MQIKLFEIRDRATFIPAMAIKIDGNCADQEDWLLRKAGYGDASRRDYIYLIHLQTGEGQYDAYKWGGYSRTMANAHLFIQQNFDTMESGEVVDVEHMLGETMFKKISERISD